MQKLRGINVSTRLGIVYQFQANTPPNPTPPIPASDVKTIQMAHKLTCFHIGNINTEGMELNWSIRPTLVNNQNLRLL